MRIFTILFVLQLFCGTGCSQIVTEHPHKNQARKNLYELLEKGNTIDYRFDELLRRIGPRIVSALNDSRKVLVNANYSETAINLYVLHPENLHRINGASPAGFRDWQEVAEIVEGNFVTVPPNLVFVDGSFLGLFLMAVNNESINITRANFEAMPGLFDPASGQAMPVAGAWARYKRMQIMELDSNTLHRKTEAWDTVVRKKMPIAKQEELFFIPMLLVLGHEFAHLSSDSDSDRYKDLFELIEKQRREEDVADDIAVEAVRKFYNHLVLSHASASGGTAVEEVPAFESAAILAIAFVLRDEVAVGLFNGLRGFSASDLFVNVTQWGEVCDNPVTANGKIDLANVRDAINLGYPVLTRTEFDNLRWKIRSERLLAAHSHNFIRADKILNGMVKFMPEIRLSTEAEIRLLNAIEELRPSEATPTYVQSLLKREGLGIPRKNLTRALDSEVRFEHGVTCPPDMCVVGFIEQSSGYIEILGPPSNVNYVRIVALTENDQHRKIFARLIERLLTGAVGAITDWEGNEIRKATDIISECAGSSGDLILGARHSFIKRLNRSPYSMFELGSIVGGGQIRQN